MTYIIGNKAKEDLLLLAMLRIGKRSNIKYRVSEEIGHRCFAFKNKKIIVQSSWYLAEAYFSTSPELPSLLPASQCWLSLGTKIKLFKQFGDSVLGLHLSRWGNISVFIFNKCSGNVGKLWQDDQPSDQQIVRQTDQPTVRPTDGQKGS